MEELVQSSDSDEKIREINMDILNQFYVRLYQADLDFYQQFYKRLDLMKKKYKRYYRQIQTEQFIEVCIQIIYA